MLSSDIHAGAGRRPAPVAILLRFEVGRALRNRRYLLFTLVFPAMIYLLYTQVIPAGGVGAMVAVTLLFTISPLLAVVGLIVQVSFRIDGAVAMDYYAGVTAARLVPPRTWRRPCAGSRAVIGSSSPPWRSRP